MTFVEITKQPYMMPGGGVAGTGETVSLDPTTAAILIASGGAVSSSAPGAFTPLPTTRVKLNVFLEINTPIYSAGVLVGVSPATFDPGEVATFLAPIAAALIANGQAVSN